MTSNKYTMLLISSSALLFVFFTTLAMLLVEFDFGLNLKPYRWSILSVLIIYPVMAISITSYLLSRSIFTPKKSKVNKKLLAAFLLLVCSITAILSYELLVHKGIMLAWQYFVNLAILVFVFIIFPMLLARPNKFLLKLTAQAHTGF